MMYIACVDVELRVVSWEALEENVNMRTAIADIKEYTLRMDGQTRLTSSKNVISTLYADGSRAIC
jgi:hypothetical protein